MLTITIRPLGYLANQMFEYMFAKTLEKRIKRPVRYIKYDSVMCDDRPTIWPNEFPRWGLSFPKGEFTSDKTETIRGNLVDYDGLVRRINDGKIDNLIISGTFCNLKYYDAPEAYRDMFIPPVEDQKHIREIDDKHLLIHVRGGDIIEGAHKDYFPLPFNYYHMLIEKTGLIPVFMGQIGKDKYSEALKQEFKQCEFLSGGTVVGDFETVRRAKHVATSISSFAWLSSWLSSSLQSIHFPLGGIMSPFQRPDMDFVPRNDPRYHFYKFDIWKFKAGESDFARIFENGIPFKEFPVSKIPVFKNRLQRAIYSRFRIQI